MPYSEAAFFDGNHCHHCATRDEHLRNERIAARCRDIARENASRRGIQRRLMHCD